MKKSIITAIALFSLFVMISGVSAETSIQPNSQGFSVARMVIAGSIEDREPVGAVNVFSSVTEKVYCFLEAEDIQEDTTVSFVWYFEEKEMASVELPIRQSSRWRTYSSKKLAGLKGTWQVVLKDADGTIIRTVEFSVE